MPKDKLDFYETLNKLNEAANDKLPLSTFCQRVEIILKYSPKFEADFEYIWKYKFEYLSPYPELLPSSTKFSAISISKMLRKVIHEPRAGNNNDGEKFAGSVDCIDYITYFEEAAQLTVNILLTAIILDKLICKFKNSKFNGYEIADPSIVDLFGVKAPELTEGLITSQVVLAKTYQDKNNKTIQAIMVVQVLNLFASELAMTQTKSLINRVNLMAFAEVYTSGQTTLDTAIGETATKEIRNANINRMTKFSELAKKISEQAEIADKSITDQLNE